MLQAPPLSLHLGLGDGVKLSLHERRLESAILPPVLMASPRRQLVMDRVAHCDFYYTERAPEGGCDSGVPGVQPHCDISLALAVGAVGGQSGLA